MKLKFRTPSGPVTVSGEITKRYKVNTTNATTDADVVQFWTWMKYEFPHLDQNKNESVFGASELDFNKIQNHWQNKFTFQA